MKATLRLNLDKPEHKKELNRCLKAYDYLAALDDVTQCLFRPARKHGYSDRVLQELLEGKIEDTKAFEKAKEELDNMVIAIEEHGSEEQRAYLKQLQGKLYTAELASDTTFAKGIELLEEKFREILNDRNITFEDL